jgi:selenophosphate synthetase-related protein
MIDTKMELKPDQKRLVDKYVKALEWLHSDFSEMDDLIKPVMGVRDWDDSTCIVFGDKKLLVSVDGPYSRRLVLKSALIHATTDVVVKGGRPLFALDTLIGSMEDVREMASSLKKQALAMQIPILGGNTLFEDVEPRCSLTVVGELMLKEPIRDSTARRGDFLVLLGEPIWGSQGERILKARKLFETWFEILDRIEIHAAKDVTKGGLIPTLYELSVKSDVEFMLEHEMPFPTSRNLDNFLLSVSETGYRALLQICEERECEVYKIGVVE